MRKTETELFHKCQDVRDVLRVDSFEFHMGTEESYAIFRVTTIKRPKLLSMCLEEFCYSLYSDGNEIVVQIDESLY